MTPLLRGIPCALAGWHFGQQQVRDAPKCTGRHAHYNDKVNERNLFWSCLERGGETEKTMSCLGSKLAIILLERGMPSRCASSKHIDYVPAICTHRPSLLPMPVGYRLTDSAAFGPAGEVTPCLTSRGSKSRNKVAVGEPAAGSFREFSNFDHKKSKKV